jgi:outer membrane protein assembly factor BamA
MLQVIQLPAQQDSSGIKINLNKNKLIVLPVVSKSIETGWAFGLAASFTYPLGRIADSFTRTSNMQAIVLYSTHRQFAAVLHGTTYFPGEKYILNSHISYAYYPDKFWGLGRHAPDGNLENYTYRQLYVYPHLMRSLYPHLYIGALMEFQEVFENSYKAGGLFDQQKVAGRNGYFISGTGMSLTWDSRNHAFVPSRGSFVQVLFDHFYRAIGSDFTYTNIAADVRKFIAIGKKSVAAFQGYWFVNYGPEIPLRSLASFGGAFMMRGYYGGRYRDRNMVLVQAEFRRRLFWRLGGVLFGGLGDVYNKSSDLDLSSPKYSYGAGMRFALNRKEQLNIRIDYGFGQRQNDGLYIQLGEAF